MGASRACVQCIRRQQQTEAAIGEDSSAAGTQELRASTSKRASDVQNFSRLRIMRMSLTLLSHYTSHNTACALSRQMLATYVFED